MNLQKVYTGNDKKITLGFLELTSRAALGIAGISVGLP